MNYTDRVIRFVKETHWENLPEPVRHQSKRCLLDTLGALLAGTDTPVSKLVSAFVQDQFRGNEGTILGSVARASLVGAAFANGTAANALDIDDGYRLVKGHPGACVLPVAMGAGEAAGCTGRAFLTALVVGYEVGIRAGLIRHAVSQTYHSSGSWGAVAGAAAACKLFGFDMKTVRQALGTAEYHAPIAPMMKGIQTPSMGKDSIGWGCLVAMSAALLAQKGFTGIQPLFDDTPEPSWILNMGETYEILNLYFKPYAACRWAQPAIEGALKIARDNDLSIEQIARITVRTFSEAAALDQGYPQTTEDAQYNISFPLAVALLDGEIGPRQVLPPRIFDHDVHCVMDKVEVVAERSFQNAFPASALAEVHIETRGGESFRSGTMPARWEPSSGLPSDAELVEKFYWLAEPIMGIEKAREIEHMVWGFENCEDMNGLINLCNR
jgi:2-methylcitrate dehydratase PrpD